MKLLSIFCLFALSAPVLAASNEKNPALIDMETGVSRPAPDAFELNSYLDWVTPLLRQPDGSELVSAFTPLIFDWYQEQIGLDALPREVYQSPDLVWVRTDRALAQTIEMEEAGEITEGNTVGGEVYAEMTGTVDQGLEAMMFVWGKPAGAIEGLTYPDASPFSRRVEYFAPLPELGDRVFANMTLRRDGGIIKNLSDRYFVIIRGDSEQGYTVAMQYVKPALKTYSERCFALAILKPLPNGKFSYRISTRYQGQSYKILGNIGIGRAQIGFNKEKMKDVAISYRNKVDELRTTGTIKDKQTDIEWGKEK